MLKTLCASRCSRRLVHKALRAPAEGEGGEGGLRREERVQNAFFVDHHGPGDARLSHSAAGIYGESGDYVGWLRAELRARCAYPRPRGADPERTLIYIWVSSTGFRQPGLLCAFLRRLVTVHVSPVSPSLNKEGNAACARQVCRKVTTRETREQRRISTWDQNLRVLKGK